MGPCSGIHPVRNDTQAIALSAAAIFGGAAFIGIVEGLLPGGQAFSLAPAFAALVLALATATLGPRLPRPLLTVLGPFGAVLIAGTLATTVGYGDAAIFYTWPMLWMAYFYGARGTAFMVVWIGLVHAVALLVMPDHMANADRWIDVVASVLVVGLVVRGLASRNDRLLGRLQTEARIDPLTGLLNRRGFEQRSEPLLVREGGELAVVLFDLDHFKQVNDEYGHDQGDRVLRWFAGVLAERSRGVDVVARLGGEEFIVLLPRTSTAAAHRFAERVRAAIEQREDRLRHGVPGTLAVTVSAGIAGATAPVAATELVAAADGALYAAKRGGRNRACVAA